MVAPDGRIQAAARAAIAGDERAWEVLVRHYTPMLRRVAKGFRLAPYEIDDVVQACWLALLEDAGTVREPGAVGGWLATAARRQSMRMRQRETREVLTDEAIGEEIAGAGPPEETIEQAERARAVQAAVDRLPGRQRELLRSLIDEPGRSYAEVAQGLGMPIGSIGPTRERGLSRLRDDAQLVRTVAS